MKTLIYYLWVLIKNLGILMLFLALTFLLLESIKYYQSKYKNVPEKAVIIVDDTVIPSSFDEIYHENTLEKVDAIIADDNIAPSSPDQNYYEDVLNIMVEEAEALPITSSEPAHPIYQADAVSEEQIFNELEQGVDDLQIVEVVSDENTDNKHNSINELEQIEPKEQINDTSSILPSYEFAPDSKFVSEESVVNDNPIITDNLSVIKTEFEPIVHQEINGNGNGVDDERAYNLYEEELPQDIIIESGIHRDIRDIIVEPTQKPPYFGETPVIAIVIDDMGISKKRTRDINSLDYPLTSSFLTYGNNLDEQIYASIKAGHEVMAHIPMEAKTKTDAAPDVLKVSMSDEDIIKALNQMISKFDNIKGVNNHMGSKFTENREKMYDVMEVLKEKNLFFLDSRTSNKSTGREAAEKYQVAYVNRNIFLDNENELNYILGQLRATEKVAAKKGYAIAIGHPKSQTYVALKQWLPSLKERGFKLVHLSEIVDVINKHKEITENE